MKFRSPTDEPLHIALTSGHTAVVTAEGKTLDPMFQREAIARGALVGDTVAPILGAADQFDRKQIITDALNAMMDGDNPEDFNDDGKPALKRLNARLGFQASRSEVDAVFDELTKNASQV
ncbi:MAG: hypothetical protein ACK4OE_04540 [Acidovorax sp.]|uniref:hypothetical protein n=1 Tax=Acidovorax sp. TaxID=1872122 RepID=UPI00391A1403